MRLYIVIYNVIRKYEMEVQTMMLVKFLLKVLMIVLIVPVFILMMAVKLLVNLSSYILGPFILFLIGCAITQSFKVHGISYLS